MSQERQPVLWTDDLYAGYSEVNILHGVSIRVPDGGMVAIVGPNGAGKSTLLKAMYGLLTPRQGRVMLRRDGQERDLVGRRPHELTALGMNYVPQLANVFTSLSVRENLEMGAYLAPRQLAERAERIFELFPILRERSGQRAGTMSAGQRQMLALARALMTEPSVLLLDEPSAGLAPVVVDEVFDKVAEINRQGIAIVIVEQNARRSLGMSDHGYVLDMGRNRFEGPGPQLLNDERVVDLYLGGRPRGLVEAAEDYEATPQEPQKEKGAGPHGPPPSARSQSIREE